MQNEVLSDIMHTRGTKLIALNNSNGFQPYCPTPMISNVLHRYLVILAGTNDYYY